MMINKTFKVYTLGCKVNQYDSQLFREKFRNIGANENINNSPSDICLVNTCTVTQKADSKSRNLIRKAIKNNPGAKIMVAGCLAQDNKNALENIEGVDVVLDNNAKRDFLDESLFITNFSGHTRAFVKIQDGCDKFCSYCKVPYVRGRPQSRKTADIIKEAERLCEKGFKEIVLCGICLGNFTNLVGLIERLEKITILKRIRLSSIEAKDVSISLIKKIASSDKLCKHLHIPFQSGDDKILAGMNRKYTQKYYLDLSEKLRNTVKDIAITTDIIVGFPGETEKCFLNTIKLLEETQPLKVHLFPFSARRGTVAYSLGKKIAEKIIKERVDRLKAIASELSFLYRRQFINKTVEVLVEGSYNKDKRFLQGYSSNYINTLVTDGNLGTNYLNELLKVKIIKVDKENNFAERMPNEENR